MARPSISVLAIYVAVALFVVLLVFYAPSRTNRPHRRLKLRSFDSRAGGAGDAKSGRHAVAFDPIIADIERIREDREWHRQAAVAGALVTGGGGVTGDEHAPGMEGQPEWHGYVDAEDYINDAWQFNLSRRISDLFPKIDTAPAYGVVTAEELAAWNLVQSRREVLHRSQRDMDLHDKNKDGFVSFAEYQRPTWAWRFDDDNETNGNGWWKEDHFNASDADGNGLLNLTEFNDFLHPADCSKPKLVHWLSEQEVRERDKDRDGKLNFQEFFNGLFYSLRNFDDYGTANEPDGSEAPAKRLFSQLDENNDGLLDADEVKPVIGNLHPSEHFYAKQQADYVMSQADSDKDGHLTLQEMIDHPYSFYSAIFAEDENDYHDEFR